MRQWLVNAWRSTSERTDLQEYLKKTRFDNVRCNSCNGWFNEFPFNVSCVRGFFTLFLLFFVLLLSFFNTVRGFQRNICEFLRNRSLSVVLGGSGSVRTWGGTWFSEGTGGEGRRSGVTNRVWRGEGDGRIWSVLSSHESALLLPLPCLRSLATQTLLQILREINCQDF